MAEPNEERAEQLLPEAEPAIAVDEAPEKSKRKPKRLPPYHVVLWDDNDHGIDYVVRMMQALFGHPPAKGRQIAEEVDTRGRAIVLTTAKEHAEFKRDQIRAFGISKDELAAGCKGSMSASIEPAAT